MIIYHSKLGVTPGMEGKFNIQNKSMWITVWTNLKKKKELHNISETQKMHLTKSYILIKHSQQIGLEEQFCNCWKAFIEKSTCNIILRLNLFSLGSIIRHICLLSSFLFNIVLEFLFSTINKNWKAPSCKKKSLFTDNIIIYKDYLMQYAKLY